MGNLVGGLRLRRNDNTALLDDLGGTGRTSTTVTTLPVPEKVVAVQTMSPRTGKISFSDVPASLW
eukprot:CAMPEP_0115334822 /NCGR_PEP_ID=MMETSP0270-20121206/88109_1 /TAXON_ID=71861 /ORGANISM="Scrippsiella trochoidea, Strain CCMP3099" /LENGTH=64 /DNA_ID=CAMNT_0002755817 /DNA_START=6 /DNA_END=197 /DNA_ORIENTATION=+